MTHFRTLSKSITSNCSIPKHPSFPKEINKIGNRKERIKSFKTGAEFLGKEGKEERQKRKKTRKKEQMKKKRARKKSGKSKEKKREE